MTHLQNGEDLAYENYLWILVELGLTLNETRTSKVPNQVANQNPRSRCSIRGTNRPSVGSCLEWCRLHRVRASMWHSKRELRNGPQEEVGVLNERCTRRWGLGLGRERAAGREVSRAVLAVGPLLALPPALSAVVCGLQTSLLVSSGGGASSRFLTEALVRRA